MAEPNLSSFIWTVADLLRGDYKQSEYVSGQAEAIQQAEQRQVIEQAKTSYIAMGGTPLHVTVHFSANGLSKLTRRRTAEWIAALVYQNQPAIGETFHWNAIEQKYGTYPPTISSVLAHNLTGITRHCWPHNFAAWSCSGVVESIEAAIASKETKIDLYTGKCDQCWLLLVADYNHGSVALFDWDGIPQRPFVTECFPRVFIASLTMCSHVATFFRNPFASAVSTSGMPQ